MKFPEWLYKLLPGDAGTQQLGVIWRQGGGAANLATVGQTIYTVPSDKCLVLTNAVVHESVPAAVSLILVRLMADPPAGDTRYDILSNETNLAGVNARSDNWTGEVVIPGGWRVRAEGNFTLADPANEIRAEIHGYLIPRGTFVFG